MAIFDLPEKAIREARAIVVGPAMDNFDDVPRDIVHRCRANFTGEEMFHFGQLKNL